MSIDDTTNGTIADINPLLFRYDPQDPTAKVEEETDRANEALRDYCLMGAGRSLRGLVKMYEQQMADNPRYRPPSTAFSTIATWSAAFQWVARANDYDRLERESRMQLRQKRIEQWEEKAWEAASALMDKASQMLKFPIIQTTTTDGKTTVEPARWNMDTIPRLVQVADRMARLSTGSETEIQKIRFDWRDTLPQGVKPEDVEALLDEMAAQVLAGMAKVAETDEPEVNG
ncbi:MAG: hypothetical protein KJ077_10585 [Anaerolineae bacterium]|nr:hypothetical protein [Anaerolineae bacterium]